jgi:hypothetical protein
VVIAVRELSPRFLERTSCEVSREGAARESVRG